MRTVWIILFVVFAGYTALVYTQGGSGTVEIADDRIRAGMHTWQEQNCTSCHQLYGLGGYMGPDLTNAHRTFGEHRMRTFIRYGTGRMPAHALSEAEIDGLIAFLAWVDRTGTSQVAPDNVHWTGTYIIEPTTP